MITKTITPYGRLIQIKYFDVSVEISAINWDMIHGIGIFLGFALSVSVPIILVLIATT